MGALKQALTDPRVVRVCQVAIGVLFAVAALSKLGDLKSFASEVHNFRIVPIALENLVAITLPWIELVAAMALIVGIRARAGGLIVTSMLAAFTLAIIAALVRGLDIECGCFGTADAQHVGVMKVLENLGMLAVAAVASLRPR